MKPLSFFNWSLSKALDIEPDSFLKARIRIIYTILLFSIAKAVIVITIGSANDQWLQVTRAAMAMLLYIGLIKLVLYKPQQIKTLTHIMLIAGVLIVWTNIFMYAHRINLVSIQFVFMIVLSSFYILGSRIAMAYSFVSILPVMLFLVFKGNLDIYFANAPQELASPGFEIIVVLNFISIIMSHYLFFEAFNENIREKEQLNLQLQSSIAEANKLAATRSNFLSTISHELRTPLNSVIGITELLMEDKPEPRQQENLKILQFSALDLLSLINNVLDINKIDSDMLELEAIPFRLAEVVQNICSGLRIKATDKQLNFLLDIDQRLSNTTVISDPTRISQLINNLVSNAIKFTEKGNITVKLECTNESTHGVDVLFSVTDTGTGIHPDRHDSIFELFTQAESHITRKYGGTGLGLAIVKQVLALFGSAIHLESSPGNGSRFYFTVHFTTVADALANTPPAITETPERPDLSHLKILVAEDNDVNRLIMKKQLDKMNLVPQIVENGKQAYDAVMANHYHAVLMDLHMPELDGYEATRQIRALADAVKAGTHIIAFTASVTEQQKIMDHGFNDFLYKPVNMHDLRDKLEQIAARDAAKVAEGSAVSI